MGRIPAESDRLEYELSRESVSVDSLGPDIVGDINPGRDKLAGILGYT